MTLLKDGSIGELERNANEPQKPLETNGIFNVYASLSHLLSQRAQVM